MKIFIFPLLVFFLFFDFYSQVNSQKEAVCIIGAEVGNLEGDKEEMDKTVELLKSKNYKVHKFYSPNNSWEEIKKVSINASIIIYRGHGTHLGIDGGFGGIVVDEFISGQRISEELKLGKNALVIFVSACGGAGSSADDEKDIGVVEAQQRIVGSSLPFMITGAKGYYADNYQGGHRDFLTLLFENKTLSEAYQANASKWNTIEKHGKLNESRINSAYMIGISSKEYTEKTTVTKIVNGIRTTQERIRPKSYAVAYVGDPNFKITTTSLLTKN